MKTDDLLVVSLAATRLRLELDNVPLWRGDHVAVKALIDDFARYTYLPRLRDSDVLIDAIPEGLGLLAWNRKSFRLRRWPGMTSANATAPSDAGSRSR